MEVKLPAQKLETSAGVGGMCTGPQPTVAKDSLQGPKPGPLTEESLGGVAVWLLGKGSPGAARVEH